MHYDFNYPLKEKLATKTIRLDARPIRPGISLKDYLSDDERDQIEN